MSYEIVKLTSNHDVGDFDCGDADIDKFLKMAFEGQEQFYSVTYVMVSKENEDIMAYATVANGVIKMADLDENLFSDFTHPELPALLLGRLGRDKKYRGVGFGQIMVKYCIGLAHELSKTVGCRVVYVDSYVSRVSLYEDLGFRKCSEELKEEDGDRNYVTLYYDLFEGPEKA